LKPNVNFKDKSTYAISWRWSLGDDKISTDQNPDYKNRWGELLFNTNNVDTG
jgi:hypothetical protein